MSGAIVDALFEGVDILLDNVGDYAESIAEDEAQLAADETAAGDTVAAASSNELSEQWAGVPSQLQAVALSIDTGKAAVDAAIAQESWGQALTETAVAFASGIAVLAILPELGAAVGAGAVLASDLALDSTAASILRAVVIAGVAYAESKIAEAAIDTFVFTEQEIISAIIELENNSKHNNGNSSGGKFGRGGSSGAGSASAGAGDAGRDPIVVDLTGNGINLINLSQSDTYFDYNGNGFSVNTAWTGPGNGFLVIKSGDPALGVSIGNGYELLGTGTVDAYSALKSLISNDSGTISSSDTLYSTLGVWQDTNNDGVADSSEISSLSDLGVTSISLNNVATNNSIDGSTIDHVSSITFANGQVNQIAEVKLAVDNTFSEYTGNYTLSSTIEALPDVKGYGLLPDLQIQMSFDPNLLGIVEAFSDNPPVTVQAYDASVQEIMYEWAGVNNVNPASGSIFDGQKLDFLEDYVNEDDPFSTLPSVGREPWFAGQAIELNSSWNDAFDEIEARLLVQTNSTFGADFQVIPKTDLLLPVPSSSLVQQVFNTNPNIDASIINYVAAIDDIEANEPTNILSEVGYWVQALDIISQSVADYLQYVQINTQALITTVGGGIPFFISSDVIDAALSGTLTYVEMSGLNNVVYGTAGSDLYDVSTPNMTIEGFGGGDEIIVNKGAANLNINEVENNPANTNVLFFAPGISEADLTVTTDANGDVILTYDAQGDQVTLDSMASMSSSGYEQGPLHTTLPYTSSTEFGVQEVIFANGTTLSAAQVIDMVSAAGSPTNTVLLAEGVAQTFDPKGYAHQITGTNAPDTVIYNTNYGDIDVNLNNDAGSEQSVLQFGSGISAAELLVGSDASGDLILTLGTTGNQITLNGMNASSSNGVASVSFVDGTTLTAQQLLVMARLGSPQNRSIYANADATLYDPNGYAHFVSGITAGDTVVYNKGYGDLTIAQSTGGVLALGSSVSVSDIEVSIDGQGDIILTDLATGSTININGMGFGGLGVNEVTFADGTTWTATQIATMADVGSARNLNLYSDADNNYFDPNGYAHYVQGNGGGDTIVYNLGYGNLTINENGPAGLFGPGPMYDVLQFGAGITASDVSVSDDGANDIVLTVLSTGAQIVIQNMLQYDSGGFFSHNSGVTAVNFSDGTSWSAQQIIQMAEIGSSTNTTIYGAALANTIDPAGYAHTIIGTGGASIIDYNLNYGSLTIEASGYNDNSVPTIVFGPGITESDVFVTALGNGSFGVIIGATQSTITLNGFDQLGSLQFSDGTVWSANNLLALAQIGSPYNTVLTSDSSENSFDPAGYAHSIFTGFNETDSVFYNAGYGQLTINDTSSYYYASGTGINLVFGSGINENDITASVLGYTHGTNIYVNGLYEQTADEVIALDVGSTSDQITINGFSEIQSLTFADGTEWSSDYVLQQADIATPDTRTLYADAQINNFDTKGFAHTIIANVNQDNQVDTIQYNSGYGNLYVEQADAPTSKTTYDFGPGISESSVSVSYINQSFENPSELLVTVGSSADVITIVGQSQLGGFEFADGTTWSAGYIFDLADVAQPGENTLYSDSSSNVFDPNGNAHSIIDQGGSGQDTIVYNQDYGNLTIYESTAYGYYNGTYGNLTNSNILAFGTGITEADVSVSQDASGDILLSIAGTGSVITLDGMALAPPGNGTSGAGFGVSEISFATGTTWTSAQIVAMSEVATPSNSVLNLSQPTTLNDDGYLTEILGSSGNDTISFNAGDPNLTIHEAAQYGVSPQSVLQLGTGISESDVQVTEDANGDIFLNFGSVSGTVDLVSEADQNYNNDALTNGIASVDFADGTSWSNSYLISLASTPSQFNTVLYSVANNTTFDSKGIATSITDTEDSYSAANTYIYNQGYGNLAINEYDSFLFNGEQNPNAIQFGPGISSSNIEILSDQQGDVIVTSPSFNGSLTITGMFGNDRQGVGNFLFSDGTSLTEAQIISLAETGSSTNENLYGSDLEQTIYTNGFATFVATDNNIIDYGSGDENLQIDGYVYNDYLLQLGTGISTSNVVFSFNDQNGVVMTLLSNGAQITFDDGARDDPTIEFADGTTLLSQQIIDLVQITHQQEIVLGGTGFDTLTPSGSDASVIGQGGADTIEYTTSNTSLYISEQNSISAEKSILQFGSGISLGELSFSDDASGDVLVTVGSSLNLITLVDMLNNPNAGVSELTFANGSSLTALQISTLLDVGSSTNQILYGNGGSTTLSPDGFAYEVIDEKGGTDTINYTPGSGGLVIDEVNQAGSEASVLSFGAGITAGDITLSTDANSVLVSDGTSGDAIAIEGMLNGSSFGVSEFRFFDGSTMSASDIDNIANADVVTLTPSESDQAELYSSANRTVFDPEGIAHYVVGFGQDKIIYDQGYGNLEIDESGNSPEQSVVQFGTGISESDIAVVIDPSYNYYNDVYGYQNITIELLSNGSSITLDGMATTSDDGVGYITFEDGTTLTASQLISMANTGSPYNTTIAGGYGGDVYNPNGYAHAVFGTGQSDTIIYDSGYGNLTINEPIDSYPATPTSTLSFGSGIDQSDISVSSNGSDIYISILNSGTIDLVGQINGSNSGSDGVALVKFSDGTTLTAVQLEDLTLIGSPNTTTLHSGLGTHTINPNGYVNSIIDTSGGDDTILYNRNFGSITITEQNSSGPEQSVLQFGSGISESDLSFSNVDYLNSEIFFNALESGNVENLIVTDVSTGSQITLSNMAYSETSGVGSFVFFDGTTISAAEAITLADTGSPDNTTLVAGYGSAEVFDPNGYAHTINDLGIDGGFGQLFDTGGPNTILYDIGYGNINIDLSNPNGTEQSVILFGAGITDSGISITPESNGDVVITIETTGSQLILAGMANDPDYGVGSLVFSDGTTIAPRQFLHFSEVGNPYQTVLTSTYSYSGTFDPAGFAHLINGGSSDNTILYNAGYGDLTINESSNSTEQSTLKFGAGILASDIEAVGDSSGDIVITIATLGTTITLTGMLNSHNSGVGTLIFTDGSTISAAQLAGMAEIGSPTNTTLYANGYGAAINPNGPAHVFTGNGGVDKINYDLIDGNLIINENSSGYGSSYYGPPIANTGPVNDIINFGSGISVGDISASAQGNNVILTVAETGSQITLSNMLLNGQVEYADGYYPYTLYTGVGTLTFEDGATLSSEQVIRLLDTGSPGNTVLTAGQGVNTLDPGGFAHIVNGDGGSDTIIYNPGYGNLIINETNPSGSEQSVLQIGSGISEADIAINGDASGDIILTDVVTGNEITLTGMLASVDSGVGSIVFHDLNTLTAAQVLIAADTGTPTNTVLYAGAGNTTFHTGGSAQIINGNGGADTILYTASATPVQINETLASGSEQSILQFGSGISISDVTIATDGYGDVLLSLGSLGAQIDITNMLNGTRYGVAALEFANGTSLSAQQIDDDAGGVAPVNATLYATLANSILDTKGYDSTIQGNGGADTIIYNPGYGNLTIIEQNPVGPEESVLQLGAGISPDDIAVSQDASGDILLTVSSSSVIKLFGMASSDQNGVASVTFVDGTTWSASQIIAMTDVGSSTNTTLTAGPGNNVFNPQGLARVVNGDGGADVIMFNRGYGQLTINEENQSGAEQSVLQFGSGITAGELSVSQDAFGDIILMIGTSGDQVTLSSMLHSGDNGIAYGVGEATFSDGTTLSAQQLFNLADTGTFNNTVLHTGPDSGTINPAGYADLVEGYDGQNTILYNNGYGDLTINEQIYGSSAQSILQFGSGISASELNYSTVSSGNIILSIGSSGEEITLSNMINTGTNDIGYGVGSVSFLDGTTLSAAQVIAYAEALPPPVASTISVASALVSSTDEESINFLSGTSIIDPNAGTVFETLTITPSSTLTGTLYDPNSLTDGSTIINGAFTISAAETVLNGLIHELSFIPVPHQVAPGDTVTTQFTIFDLNSSSLSSSAEVSVVATAVNDAPTITGSNFLQSMRDEGTLGALSSIVINDPDVGVTDAALITLTGTGGVATDGNGTLSGIGLTKIGTGLYSLVASTPGSLTAELDALVFTPQAHQVAPGGTVMTAIELAVSQNGASSTYAAASIVVTAENDKPEIAGTKTSQTITNEATLHALSSVVISDLDVGVTDSALITLTGTGGIITDTDGTLSGAGLTKIGAGLYTLAAATPGSLTAELEALVFTPTVHQIAPSSTVITGIDIAVTQNGQTATDSTTSIIDFQNMSSGSTISGGLETVGLGGTAVSTTVLSSGIEEILSGGVSSNSTVLSGGTEYDYGASFNDTINGGTQTVYGGGTAVGTFLESGGAQYISNGVTAENTLISGGGQQYVLSGGVASDTSINYEGAQVVETGGVASGNTITVAGSSLISGGTSYATVVVNGGSEDVFAGSSVDAVINDANQFIYGGTVSGAELENHGVQYLSGGSAYATDVEGGTQVVTNAGMANGSTIVAGGRQFVYSGGVVSGNIVNAAGTDYISGGAAYATELNNGGSEQVFDGGTASGSTIDSGSVQNVYSGGLSENTTISGGLEIVSSGGVANSTSILSSGVENILVGGAASGATVGFDGEQFVSSGGTVSGTGVNSGGTEYVLTGGVEKNTVLDNGSTDFDYGQSINVTVNSGGGLAVSGGGVLTGGTLEAGGIEVIASGGQSFDETVASGGRALISGGSAYAYTLNNGREVVYAGGTASGAVVNEGGEENVFDTGTTSGAIINSGGQENISAGAIAYDVTVNSGGVEVVNGTSVLFGQLIQSDGIASGTTIKSGGYLVVLPGGIVNGATINSGAHVISSGIVDVTPTGVTVYDNSVNGGNIGGLGATQYVLSGGTTSGVVVNSGGVQSVVSSGISVDSIIASGGIQVVSSGGYSVGPIVSSGGIELVSGGNVFFANINSGGYDAVYNGGTTADTTINSGATEILYSGGVSNEAIVHNGGQETVAGGVATDTTLQIGGSEVVDSGGIAFVTSGFTASGLSIRSSGQNIIQAGGFASATTVTSGGSESNFGSSVSATIIGGEELIENGGTAVDLSITQDGFDIVDSGGMADATTLLAGATEYDFGSVTSAIVNSGGQELVLLTGSATGNTVGLGGQQIVYSGGTATDTDLLFGGSEIVYSGGITSDTTIQNGGSQLIYFSGDVVGTSINSGGLQTVEFYGTTSDTTIEDGGTESVTDIGTADNTSILSGGIENVSVYGNSSNTTIRNGGTENVLAGGTETGSTIYSGGIQIVSSGGAVVNTTIDGGTVILDAGSVVGGGINFIGNNGTLVISGSALPTNVISGFDASGTTGDDIDLTGYSFSSSDTASLGANNVLTLNLSGAIETLSFNPTQNFSNDYFAIEENSLGQVVVVDPTISSSTSSSADFGLSEHTDHIDTGLMKLIAAMAEFSAGNPLSNLELANQIPANTNLEAAIAANWHS